MGRNNVKLTIDEVKSRLKDINPNIEILSEEYVNANTKLKCKCLIDGHEWYAKWNNLQQGSGCLICGFNRLTIRGIENRLKDINPSIKILSDKYINAHTKLKCKCLIDGYEWDISWNHLSKGAGCPKCGIKSASDKKKLTIQEIKIRLIDINPDIEILSEEYINISTKLKLKCLIDGYEWSAVWNSLQQGSRCPECSRDVYKNNSGYNTTLAERKKDKWLNKKTNVYFIKCFNENEVFYKIGIAKHIKNRFSGKCMPYQYTILKEVHTNLYDAVYLENKLHALNKEFAYTPQIKFAGYTECFSNLHSFDIEKEMC